MFCWFTKTSLSASSNFFDTTRSLLYLKLNWENAWQIFIVRHFQYFFQGCTDTLLPATWAFKFNFIFSVVTGDITFLNSAFKFLKYDTE